LVTSLLFKGVLSIKRDSNWGWRNWLLWFIEEMSMKGLERSNFRRGLKEVNLEGSKRFNRLKLELRWVCFKGFIADIS